MSSILFIVYLKQIGSLVGRAFALQVKGCPFQAAFGISLFLNLCYRRGYYCLCYQGISPWRWRQTLQGNQKIPCSTRYTYRDMKMSGKWSGRSVTEKSNSQNTKHVENKMIWNLIYRNTIVQTGSEVLWKQSKREFFHKSLVAMASKMKNFKLHLVLRGKV